jgi:alpha-glucosidase
MHTRALRFLGPLLAAAMTQACGEPEPPPTEGGELTLADGTRVVVSDGTGAVALFDGERPLLATPENAAPTARTFGERVTGTLAIWSFRRGDEVVYPYERFAALREEGDAVVVEYELVPGEGAEEPVEGTATLTVAPGEREDTTVLRLETTGVEANSVALPVRCDPEGSFHGFGEQYNATEQTGEAFDLIVSEQGIGREGGLRDISGDEHTTYFPMPYYLDARGFGVLVRTDHRVHVDVCAEDAGVAWLEVIDGAPLELVVFHGPTPLDVIAQLGEEVGRPAPPPEWAWGTWISSQGGREAVLADVAALEAADIDVAAIWSQDWTGVRMNVDGGFGVQYRWNADLDHYPDLGGMIAELSGRGYRFLAYANPFVDPNLDDHFPAMRDMGLLIEGPDGGPYVFPAPNMQSSHPDLTNPDARAYVQGELEEMVTDLGIDGWMADFAEWNPLDAVMSDGSDPRAYHNRFPVDWHCVNRAAMDAARPDGDWVLFARSGWTGVQACSMIHWVGDQEATWSESDGLPTVVPAMINLGLAGVPYATHDIAGFSGGPSTKELYQRWTELGAFTPIMRTHEGNRRDVNHNWDSDAETTAHFRRFSRVHDALRDDLIAWSEEAQATGAPMVRHLLLEFPDDRAAWDVHDQYMLGDAFLVAPVVEPGATTREVYLPAGATWFHVWTGDAYEGGQTVTVDAPIGSPPVFHRDEDRADLRAIAP